jgi:DNA-binding NarL/FixJ family response regulator
MEAQYTSELVAHGRRGKRADRPLRVILIEDSERILAHLEEALGDIDNLTVAGKAGTEEEALALMRAGEWDLAILDLQLKQGNGLGVLKAVRSDPNTISGKIAVFTNYAFPQYRDRSLELGADYFFDKSREFTRVLDLAEDLAAQQA